MIQVVMDVKFAAKTHTISFSGEGSRPHFGFRQAEKNCGKHKAYVTPLSLSFYVAMYNIQRTIV
jgi:hypothetical protein